jgi:hypothetical protein
MINKILFVAFTSFLFLNSCKTIDCSNQFITPAFVGFSSADLDTIIIRKFQKGTNFQQLLDTSLFTLDTAMRSNNPTFAPSHTSNDTTTVLLNFTSGEAKFILPNNDWQIFLPAKKLTVSISDIVSPQTEYKCFGDNCGCGNPITSLVQNGQQVIPQMGSLQYFSFGFGYLTYINL